MHVDTLREDPVSRDRDGHPCLCCDMRSADLTGIQMFVTGALFGIVCGQDYAHAQAAMLSSLCHPCKQVFVSASENASRAMKAVRP